jgi:hypothetical protein
MRYCYKATTGHIKVEIDDFLYLNTKSEIFQKRYKLCLDSILSSKFWYVAFINMWY